MNNLTNDELHTIFYESKSKCELCRKLGINYVSMNGNVLNNLLLNILSCINISINDLSGEAFRQRYRERKIKDKCCLFCGKKLDDMRAFNGAKFCNSSCAASHRNKIYNHRTEEERRKISETLRKKYVNNEIISQSIYNSRFKVSDNFKSIDELIDEGIILNIDNYVVDKSHSHNPEFINIKNIKYHKCEWCGRKFYARITKRGNISQSKTCCEKCKLELNRKKSKESQRKLIEEGKHQGWKSRNITSYSEKFWINVLDNNGIKYEREKIFIWGNPKAGERFFFDFYIETDGRKIDLEIDGKQHKYKDRQEHDIWRDELITKTGIEVYRIQWNEINTENGKLIMKDKIDNFLKFINWGVHSVV